MMKKSSSEKLLPVAGDALGQRSKSPVSLGPEPELLNHDDVADDRAGSATTYADAGSYDGDVQEEIFVGEPIAHKYRALGQALVAAYLALGLLALALKFPFSWAAMSVACSALMYLALQRGQSPPPFVDGCCGGFGPNMRPTLWFVGAMVLVALPNVFAWSTAGTTKANEKTRLVLTGSMFLSFAAVDTVASLASRHWQLFMFGILTTGALGLLNVSIVYDKINYDESVSIVMAVLVTLVHMPLSAASIAHGHVDIGLGLLTSRCSSGSGDDVRARRARRRERRRSSEEDDEMLMLSTS